MLKKAQNKAVKAGVRNIEFLQSDGKNIRVEDDSVDAKTKKDAAGIFAH